MKKLLVLLVTGSLLFSGCSKDYDDSEIKNRLDKIENSQIASLQQQINAINTTLPQLESVDKELKGYITTLQSTVLKLQEQINSTDSKIASLDAELDKAITDAEKANDALKKELIEQINTAKADALAQLQSTKTELLGEVEQLQTAISTLQVKDKALEKQIADLKEYVNGEIQSAKDWATQTFATLNQYNALAGDIATIQESISALNSSISALETKMSEQISAELTKALDPIKDQIASEITTKILNDISDAYTKAIGDAKSEITAAYTSAISTAINALETSIHSWVNEQLKGYYTIAQMDAKLELLQNELESQLAAQKTYLEGVITTLSTELNGKISANNTLIDALRNDVGKLQQKDAEFANKLTENATAISKNAQEILNNAKAIATHAEDIDALEKEIKAYKQEMATKIEELESHMTDTDADLVAINNEIATIRTDYTSKIATLQSALEQQIADNKALIEANKQLIEKNATAISENKAAIAALKTSAETAIAKNAAAIATNAENIAKNADLIAQNATAISNNAATIAQNASDILQLQQDLVTTKNEITTAYQEAISTAITTLDGQLRGQLATEVATINTRIDNEVKSINQTITALTERVVTLEKEVNTIKQQIVDILQEIANMKADIENLLGRIQSVSYIPKYSDGKATVFHHGSAAESFVEMDFIVSPKDAVADIMANWDEILSIKAVNTISRAIEFIEMPVLSCEADMQNGVLTVKASGENLANEFFLNVSAVNAVLFLSDGNTNISSEYIPLVAEKTEKITEYALTTTYKIESDNQEWFIYAGNIAGDENLLVNIDYGDGTFGTEKKHTYTNAGEYTVIFYFESPITEIGNSAFGYGTNILSIVIPKEVTILNSMAFFGTRLETITFEANSQLTKIGDGAFNYCSKLTSIQLPSSVSEIGGAVFGGCYNLSSISGGGADYRVDLGIYSKRGEGLYCQTIAFPAACEIETLQFAGLTYELLWGAFTCCKNLRIVDFWIDKIQQYNFVDCEVLESVNLSRTTFVANDVFTGCSKLQTLDLPLAKEIGKNSITNNESLTSISLGCEDLKVVNQIGNINIKLQTVVISAGVESIQDSFNGNAELVYIRCNAITPPALINSFDAITDAVQIYVPEASVDAYKTAEGWSALAEYIVAD